MSSAFNFTPEQREAIEHDKGPCLVLAGPGSGKTRVLTRRIIRLVERGVSPGRILAVTFTRNATEEMKRRVAEELGMETTKKIGIMTLHRWAYWFLWRIDGLKKILQDGESKRIVRVIMKGVGLNTDEETVEEVLADLTRYAGSLQSLDHFIPESCEPSLFKKIVKRYRFYKVEKGVMDLDDLLLFAYKALKRDPYLRKAVQDNIDYVLVDEFQDINPIQWKIIRILAGDKKNLYVVGDEDQSIYAFRGASPEIITKKFSEIYPETKKIILGRNFRSRAPIVEAAARLISRNSQRFSEKKLVADRKGGRPPEFFRPDNSRDEAEAILARILSDLEEDKGENKKATIGVLYRSNLSAITLIHLLEEANIPFKILPDRPSIFHRWMVQDCLSWIRWAWGLATVEEALRLLRRPVPRGIPWRVFKEIPETLRTPNELLAWLGQAGYGIQEAVLRRKLNELQKKKANAAIGFIRTELEYERFVKEYSSRVGLDETTILQVLDHLANMADPNADSRYFLVLEEKEKRRISSKEDYNNVRLTLSTFHSAKGLEWDYVYILNAVDGVTPNRRACESKVFGSTAMEEERRLFYVAMTRAREKLVISAPCFTGSKKSMPSPFILEAGIGIDSEDDRSPSITTVSKPGVSNSESNQGPVVHYWSRYGPSRPRK